MVQTNVGKCTLGTAMLKQKVEKECLKQQEDKLKDKLGQIQALVRKKLGEGLEDAVIAQQIVQAVGGDITEKEVMDII